MGPLLAALFRGRRKWFMKKQTQKLCCFGYRNRF
jgi:hypothetical protein